MFVGRSSGLGFAGTVSEVPDVTGQKMAVGAGHCFSQSVNYFQIESTRCTGPTRLNSWEKLISPGRQDRFRSNRDAAEAGAPIRENYRQWVIVLENSEAQKDNRGGPSYPLPSEKFFVGAILPDGGFTKSSVQRLSITRNSELRTRNRDSYAAARNALPSYCPVRCFLPPTQSHWKFREACSRYIKYRG
jgi:hypothetical protein